LVLGTIGEVMDDDFTPPPADIMEVLRAPTGHGWMIRFDGQEQAFFSTADDMCSWIATVLRPLDLEAGVIPRAEPIKAIADEDMPRVLAEAEQRVKAKPARMWRVFSGGRG